VMEKTGISFLKPQNGLSNVNHTEVKL